MIKLRHDFETAFMLGHVLHPEFRHQTEGRFAAIFPAFNSIDMKEFGGFLTYRKKHIVVPIELDGLDSRINGGLEPFPEP
jgi:hypothetical protein